MKKACIFLLVILIGGTGLIHASAVADAAKRERARRAALHIDSKKVKVFTNADIENLKSTLAFSYTAQPSDVEETPAPEQAVQPETQQQNNEEREALKQEREEMMHKAEEAQATINQGGGYFTRNIGNQYQALREARQRIQEIDKKLSQNQNNQGEPGEQETTEEQPPQ
jgi:hypothetical protein